MEKLLTRRWIFFWNSSSTSKRKTDILYSTGGGNGTSKETEFTVIGEDSRERPLLFHIHPVKDADAGINSIAGTIVPIDHTKTCWFQADGWEISGMAFFMLDNNWIITYWNREIEEISGVKSEKVVGRSFWDFFPAGATSSCTPNAGRPNNSTLHQDLKNSFSITMPG